MTQLSGLLLAYFVGAIVFAVVMEFSRRHDEEGWFRSLPQWKALAFAVSLLVACVLGVYGQATKAERDEATFAVGADYHWARVPLSVTWSPEELDVYGGALVASMKQLNAQVGCQLVAIAPLGTRANVRVKTSDGEPCGRAFRDLHGTEHRDIPGATWHCTDGTAEVEVKNLGDTHTAYRVFLHELGHVFRLAHDAGGIMAPAIEPMTIVEYNRKDVLALRARYCLGEN